MSELDSTKAVALRGSVRLRRLQLDTMRQIKKERPWVIDPQNDPEEMEEEAEAIEKLVESTKASETCEWKVSVYGYDTGCGHRDVLKMDGSEWCAFCGKRLTETHFAAKQEQGEP